MPVMDAEKEKTTPSVEEIEEMHEKIQQNRRENAEFAEQLDKYLSDPEKEISPITIGDTPNSLAISGANAELPVIINPSTVKKCMSEPDEHYHGHGLSSEIMKQIPDELRNPAIIFKGSKDNSLVAITELKDKNNHGIMVAVSLSERKGFSEVNRISSVYGKDNLANYLKAQIEQGNLIAANKEKAERMLHSIGLRLPRENTFISFDNSIAYSMTNVKTPSKTFPEISHEKSSEKLLPVLNAVHQKHEDRIESLSEKIAVREDKIAKNTAKIDKLTAKINRLKDTNKMLDGLSSGALSAPIKAIAERNQRRIERLEKVRIPNREAKIQKHLNRISTLERKSEVSHAKADKLAALSGAIKSFAVRDPAERRHQFTHNMDALHEASKRALSFKADKCTRQLSSLTERYAAAESSVDRLNLSEKISNIQSRKQSLTERMKRLDNLQKPFSEHTPEQVDKLMIHTESSIEKAAENQNLTLSQLAENTVANSADYLRNAELSLEGNYNDIDGVINNLPTEKSENTVENNADYLRNTELSMEENYNNIDGVLNNLPPEKNEEKINPEYFESLEKADRLIFNEDRETAEKIMQKLEEERILFSALKRSENVFAITVSKADEQGFKAVEKSIKAEKTSEFINPEYYKQLSKEERYTLRMSEEDARQAVKILGNEGVEHSAVINGDKSAVTVAQKDKGKTPFSKAKLLETAAKLKRNRQENPPQNKSKNKSKSNNIDL